MFDALRSLLSPAVRSAAARQAVLFGAFACLAGTASAQGFPSRPVTVIVPFTTGTPVDTAMRSIAGAATKLLGQQMVVENRAGANGRLGVNAVRSGSPDGHTLALVFDTLLVAQPILDPAFRIEPGKDYAPVILLVDFPLLLVTNPTTPFRDVNALVAYAKANPNKLNIAGTAGASSYFMAERFRQLAGISMTVVPYKGSTQSILDVVSGRVELLFAPSTADTFIASGKLVSIASTGKRRWSAFPNVPTLLEGNFNLASTAWYGLIAHAGTPADSVNRVNSVINTVIRQPDIAKQLDNMGMNTTSHTSPADFGAFVQAEVREWEPVLRNSNIKLE